MENENEDEDLDIEGKYKSIDNYFTCEYKNQELNDNNIVFRKWKNSMQKIYGKNGKLFRCLKDSIYFTLQMMNAKNIRFIKANVLNVFNKFVIIVLFIQRILLVKMGPAA